MNVSVGNEPTETWLAETLLFDWDIEDDDVETRKPWWYLPAQQSDKGILLKIQGGDVDTTRNRHYLTEILIYAAALKPAGDATSIITPPASSSPGPTEDAISGDQSQPSSYIKFYALPLSSQIYDEIDLFNCLDSPMINSIGNEDAQFLSSWSKDVQTAPLSPQKRQRILAKFDDATSQRKRLMRHGGEGVSKAMAGIAGPVLYERGHRPEATGLEDSQSQGQAKDHSQNQFSGGKIAPGPSASSLRSVDECQPKSKRAPLASGKRSLLRRMESVASIDEESLSLDNSNNTEQHNKAALARIIMTGMRMYGLQQRKKSPKSSIDLEASKKAPFDDFSHPTQDGEEYKLVYHQTFKAASFTFRAYLSKNLINQDIMRDVVDRHLAMFCVDPLETYKANNNFQPEFGRDQSSTQNSFEFPGTATG